MDSLIDFWKTQKVKKTQLDTYIENGASEHILKFIKLGGGAALGSVAEQYCKYIFTILDKRVKGDTLHDHTIKIKNKIIKIEQKTSTKNKSNDFMWQHIVEKYDWNILLLVAIDYNKVLFFGMNKIQFQKLVNEGKITNQGNKNKSSHQGLWCKYSNIKDDIIPITCNDDLINLIK